MWEDRFYNMLSDKKKKKKLLTELVLLLQIKIGKLTTLSIMPMIKIILSKLSTLIWQSWKNI